MDGFLEKFFPQVYRKKQHAHENNYCKYNNQVLASFTSSLYLAGLVATLVASPITRNYGRNASIVCGGISFLLGAILNASSVNLCHASTGSNRAWFRHWLWQPGNKWPHNRIFTYHLSSYICDYKFPSKGTVEEH